MNGPPALAVAAVRRLRAVWRSAGWPCRDPLEADLLARGLLSEHLDPQGRPSLRVTPEGVRAIAAATEGHRRARGAHEALVLRVAEHLQREGRLVWRGLRLRAGLPVDPRVDLRVDPRVGGAGGPSPGAAPGGSGALPGFAAGAGTVDAAEANEVAALPRRWLLAEPDLFSIRPSTVEQGLLPLAHEIKAHRSDLLADLRRPDKAAAYRALAGACWYVLREGIGDADDVPPPFGVMREQGGGFQVLRPPQRATARLGLATWLALARAAPLAVPTDPPQAALGDPAPGLPGDPGAPLRPG